MKLKYKIVIIGAGGTGTFFLKEFGRFLNGLDSLKRNSICSIYIADGDLIEDKNLNRQAFNKEDIGRNKANVMAEILNLSFQKTSFLSWPNYVTKTSDLKNIFNSLDHAEAIPIIIGCVDNHACRLLCETFFEQERNCIYFDAANEFETGEVVFAYKLSGEMISPCRSFYFPNIRGEEIKHVDELSCTELNMAAPQHIKTNMQAGEQLLAAITDLLITGNIHSGFTMFNTRTFSSQFYPYQKPERSNENDL